MTDTPYYPSTASPQWSGSPGTRDPEPVLVAVAGPAGQRRATVAFRIILAIPHLIVLYFLGIAASVVAVIGWLGALFTGRLPDFAAAYLSGYLRWYCRVGAYLLLLTDEYPPFLFEDAAYPVRVAVSPGRLNRLAVLFRLVLAIPAAILSMILLSGVATIVIFIAWLTALVAGKLPGSLHQAFVAVLRYTTRYHGYLYLLTDTYPGGLFGDKPGPQTSAKDLADGPSDGTPGYGTPGDGTSVPGYGEPASGTCGQHTSWQLVLSAGARRLVGLIFVLGLLTVVGGGIAAGVAIPAATQQNNEINQVNAAIAQNNYAIDQNQRAIGQVDNALAQVTSAHAKLASELEAFVSRTNACSTLSCIDAAAEKAAGALAVFGSRLHAVPFPAGAAAVARKLDSDATLSKQAWMELGHAASFADYANVATRAEKVGSEFDNDYSTLTASLSKLRAMLSQRAASLNRRAASLNRQAASLNAG